MLNPNPNPNPNLGARTRESSSRKWRGALTYGMHPWHTIRSNSAAAHGTLAECARVPTAEPAFHLLQRALGRPECRAGLSRAGPLFKMSSIAY